MSVFDFLKEVVEKIAVNETAVWGETRACVSGDPHRGGETKSEHPVSSGERNGRALLGQST